MKKKLSSESSKEYSSNIPKNKHNWSILKDLFFNKSIEKEADRTRQQNKIIATVMRGDFDNLKNPNVDISPIERETFLKLLNNSQISNNLFETIVDLIDGPTDKQSPEELFIGIAKDRHLQRILLYSINDDPNDLERSSPNAIKQFERKYNSPIDFEKPAESFMTMLKVNENSPAKIAEYENSMQQFKKHFFGKKQEYWDAIKALKAEVKEVIPENLRIEGDPYDDGWIKHSLTREDIERNGLGPKTEVLVGDKVIRLSDIFVASDRSVCLAYVPTDKDVVVCSYYRSRSSSSWRYLPDYVVFPTLWFGKGVNEESVTLPFELQKALSEIDQKPYVDLKDVDPKLFLLGTAKRIWNIETYTDKRDNGKLTNPFYKEQDASPIYDFGITDFNKARPETVGQPILGTEKAPDFTKRLDSFKMTTEMYGDVISNLYKSIDGSLLYTVNERINNGNREAWISDISVESELTSAGTPKHWVSGGDIVTPLYEYDVIADHYGDPYDNKGSYTNMWKNYISKTPLMKMYLKATKNPN